MNEFLVSAIVNGVNTLYRYNLDTREYSLILQGDFFGLAEWGAEDWILLQMNWPQNIFKVKSNGDSLTQLTFDNFNGGAIWSYDSQKIAFHKMDYGYYIIDKNGTPLGDIIGSCYPSPWLTTWQHPDYFISSTGADVSYCDPLAANTTILFDEPSVADFRKPNLVNDQERIVWAYANGLYVTSLSTGISTQLEETCNSYSYMGSECHPLNNRLLLQRIKRRPNVPEYANLELEAEIWVMNLDGSGKQKIEVELPD